MRTFFHALPHLQHLELIGMSMQAIHALLPSTSSTSLPSNCPCPQLRSLSIKGSEQLQAQDLDFIVGSGLQGVDIHVDAARATSVAAAVSPTSPGMKVTYRQRRRATTILFSMRITRHSLPRGAR